MAYNSAFAPFGATYQVGTSAVQVKAANNVYPSGYRIVNLTSSLVHVGWAPQEPNDATVTPVATAPSAGAPVMNVLAIPANGVGAAVLRTRCGRGNVAARNARRMAALGGNVGAGGVRLCAALADRVDLCLHGHWRRIGLRRSALCAATARDKPNLSAPHQDHHCAASVCHAGQRHRRPCQPEAGGAHGMEGHPVL